MRILYCALISDNVADGQWCVPSAKPRGLWQVLEMHLLHEEQLPFTEHEPGARNWAVLISYGCCNKARGL